MKVGSIKACLLFPVSFIIIMKLVNILRFSREKAIYKYVDLTVEAYEEYFEI